MHLVDFIIRICHDARSSDVKLLKPLMSCHLQSTGPEGKKYITAWWRKLPNEELRDLYTKEKLICCSNQDGRGWQDMG